jgi:putative flippase GtrA
MRLLEKRVGRFAFVGVINTLVNFVVLNVSFYLLGQGKLVSSITATSVTILLSFLLNRTFVFRDKSRPAVRLLYFILVSAAGVLLVQNLAFMLCATVLPHLLGTWPGADFVAINGSAAIASLCAMIWNYNSYRIVVFNDSPHPSTKEAVETA